jgi:predicted GH43/DUF377 family glycosyl hydrolase
MKGLLLQRLSLVVSPEPGNPNEVEGILNPGATRGPDGRLYLFPRIVAKGNYSRIGISRVQFDLAGDPCAIENLGIALEPEAEYELKPGGGGCEDARVTFVEPLGHYVMTYTANSHKGPRIALAVSKDLLHWDRLGLVTFEPYGDIEFQGVDNKDGSVFPVAIPDPAGRPALALLHRPLFPGTRPEEKVMRPSSEPIDVHRECIWISYRDMALRSHTAHHLCHFTSHRRLAVPVAAWERLKIGSGPPPILTRHGWLVIYHGVGRSRKTSTDGRRMIYSAGAMILSLENPLNILYRSPKPILKPESRDEICGEVTDVVFPTGIDCRDDLGMSKRLDVYYGMADDRIGVARLDLPDLLPGS